MNTQLADRIKLFNDDYLNATGNLARNFVCPITLLDESVEIIKGHVVSQSLPNCSRVWVPQRKDVDGAFSSVESDLQAAIEVRGRTTDEILTDKKLYNFAKPTVEFQGKKVKHQIGTVKKSGLKASKTKSNQDVDFIVQLPEESIGEADQVNVDLIVERDDCAAAFLSALQAAHLTMFHLLGYYYVYSYSGKRLREILNNYFVNAPRKKRDRISLAKEVHGRLMRMSIPLIFPDAPFFSGTVADNKLLMIVDDSGRDYAWGVIVRFQGDYFAVLLPLSDETSKQYELMMAGCFKALSVRPAQLETDNRRLTGVSVAPSISTLQFMGNDNLDGNEP